MLLAVKRAVTFSDFLRDSRGSWVVLVIVVVTMFGFLAWFTKWWREQGITQNSPEDLLIGFHNLRDQGDLTPEEFKVIRDRLVQKSGRSGHGDNSVSGPSDGDSAGTPSDRPN